MSPLAGLRPIAVELAARFRSLTVTGRTPLRELRRWLGIYPGELAERVEMSVEELREAERMHDAAWREVYAHHLGAVALERCEAVNAVLGYIAVDPATVACAVMGGLVDRDAAAEVRHA